MGAGRVTGLVCLLVVGAVGCGERAMARGAADNPARDATELPQSGALELDAPATLVSEPVSPPTPPAAAQAHRPRVRVRPTTVILEATPPAEQASDEAEAPAAAPEAEPEAATAQEEEDGLYASRIQEAVKADPKLADQEIEVTIVDGMVMLTGKVGDRSQSEAATALAAKALDGKLPVSNRLMLRR